MDRDRLLETFKNIEVTDKTAVELYKEISSACMDEIMGESGKTPERCAYYFSVEYLMGRMFFNNLLALGVLNEAREIFARKGFDLNAFEDVEDAALGNGGLGRLAACYLDSAANGGYPLYGFGIRYKYGLFRQKIVEGEQVEEADDWLKTWGDPWSVRREDENVEVKFADMTVTAVPYDMPIYGKSVNILRLFQAEGSEEAEKISEYLYPADDTEEGKILRIRQEYFFSAAAVGQLVKRYVKQYGRNFSHFPEQHVFQLNDTHAVFAVAEFLRLLTKEYRLTLPHAVEIAKQTFNYTNHTILPEALECWDSKLVEKVLPEIAHILTRLHLLAKREWNACGYPKEETAEMSIVRGGKFSMANVAVYISGRVNGVAEIHTKILKERLFTAAYGHAPEKFLNVTNGVTQRRWLMLCNEELANFYDTRLGHGWRKNLPAIEEIACDDGDALAAFARIKETKKAQLAAYIEKREGITLLPDAVYIAQVKRLHEYKRQFMTALAILRIYFDLKEGKLPDFTPAVFIFGAKAAGSYKRAKEIILFLNKIAELIANDAEVNGKLQVVFVQNYDVSYAEKIVAGSDVSLQVSTAGFEASGTGNMKLMMNGAVTVGTMDGANIEIVEKAGKENNYIFGATVEEINALGGKYDPVKFAEEHPRIKQVTDTLTDGTFGDADGKLKDLASSLFEETYNRADHYYVLYDLLPLVDALLKVDEEYKDRTLFVKKQLFNATHAAFFSSDRAIRTYAEKIWKI